MKHTDYEKLSSQFLEMLYLGSGIKEMLKLAEDYIKHAVYLYDISYSIIDFSPMAEQFQSHLEKSGDKFYLNEYHIGRMKRNNILAGINAHTQAFFTKEPSVPNTYWLMCPVRIKRSFIGYIICLYTEEPADFDLYVISRLAHVVSIELQKKDTSSYRADIKYTSFLTSLIDGDLQDTEHIESRLQLLDTKLSKYKYIVCISETNTLHSNIFNSLTIEKIRNTFPNSMAIIYQGNLVLLLTFKESLCQDNSVFIEFSNYLVMQNIKAGISQEYTDISLTSTQYEEALRSLKIGLEVHLSQTLFFAHDLLVEQLFSITNHNALKNMHYQLYEQMKTYDSIHNTDYTHTIRVFLQNNRNSTRTADALHIHRSTFFYRIRHIEELWNISLEDANVLFLLELFIKMDDYLK